MKKITTAGRLAIKYMALSDLAPYPRNPRRHDARQVRQIAKSIETFGFVFPIVVTGDNTVVSGHGRYQAANLLGMTEVPVIKLEDLDDDQALALRIADNRLTDVSEWDDRLLAETLKELSECNLNFDLDVIGFSTTEIDLRIEGLTVVEAAGPDRADELPSPKPGVTSKSGDLWRLGRHHVLCGNALEVGSYDLLLGDIRADIVFADAPYNVRIPGHASGNGKVEHPDFAMASGEMNKEEFTTFLTTSATFAAQFSKNGSIHYWCMDWRHMGELLQAGATAYSELKNLCVWAKNNAGMGSFYRSAHELIFVFKSGSGRHRNNVELGQHGRHRTNVWQYPGVGGFGGRSDEGNLLALHPTVKPVAMIADALLDCSLRGDVVLDPFLGSGSTLIAAERVGRACRGIEIDPGYVDTVIRRWQRYSGDFAIHADTGKRFDEIAPASTRVS